MLTQYEPLLDYEIPSRIDFGKSKYHGGPFTTEQVVYVKTFFRVLVVVLIGSIVNWTYQRSGKNLQGNDSREWYKKIDFGHIFIVCVIGAVYKFLVYPLLEKCPLHINFNYAKKSFAATCLCLLHLIILMIIEGTVQHIPKPGHNGSCIFTDED